MSFHPHWPLLALSTGTRHFISNDDACADDSSDSDENAGSRTLLGDAAVLGQTALPPLSEEKVTHDAPVFCLRVVRLGDCEIAEATASATASATGHRMEEDHVVDWSPAESAELSVEHPAAQDKGPALDKTEQQAKSVEPPSPFSVTKGGDGNIRLSLTSSTSPNPPAGATLTPGQWEQLKIQVETVFVDDGGGDPGSSSR